jgi:hypothetical protein
MRVDYEKKDEKYWNPAVWFGVLLSRMSKREGSTSSGRNTGNYRRRSGASFSF